MRRYLVFSFDFDSRALLLEPEQDHWDEEPKRLHRLNREKLIEELRDELGPSNFDSKLENFKSIGALPFSIVSYHNRFHREIRAAFVHGHYYPALVSACALAERLLNHLLLDLREFFSATPEYKRIHRKESFDNWQVAIQTLISWRVIAAEVASEFEELHLLRNKSVHFNTETYASVRNDSLSAIRHLSKIIHLQFGFFHPKHWWRIRGTRGAQFIARSYEVDPFIRKFYVDRCPYVGPYYAVKFIGNGILFLDRDSYDEREISDAEFSTMYEARTPADVVADDIPPAKGVRPVGFLDRSGHLHREIVVSTDPKQDTTS